MSGRTPAARWREAGEPDTHGTSYDCERAKLAMGHLTDDELANGAFLNYDVRPSLQDIIAKKASSPIAWMTAVKDRIRWLSRSLSEAEKERDQARAALRAIIFQACQGKVLERDACIAQGRAALGKEEGGQS